MSQLPELSLPAHSNIFYQTEVQSSSPMATSYLQTQHGILSTKFQDCAHNLHFAPITIDTVITPSNSSPPEAFVPPPQMVPIVSRTRSLRSLPHHGYRAPKPNYTSFATNAFSAAAACAADPQDIIWPDVSMQGVSSLHSNPTKSFRSGPEPVQLPFEVPDRQPSKTENCLDGSSSLTPSVCQALGETTVINSAVGRIMKNVPRRLKQTIRAVRNRQSATASRERKKNQIKELYRRIDILSKENAQLQVRELSIIRAQYAEGRKLIEQNEQQRKKISEYRMQISDLYRELERSGVKTFEKDVRRKRPHTWDESQWRRWNKFTAG